jgi:urease accessory protein
MNMKIFLAILSVILTPVLAFANPAIGDPSGLSHGFMHPLGGLDHVLAMVSVGFLAYTIGKHALWLVPAAFVVMMVVGGVIGLSGVEMPFVELGITASIAVIGLSALFGSKMPVAAAMGLVGTFAIFHGFAHGTEMPLNVSGLAYGAGFMAATAFLHATGIAACYACARIARSRSSSAA